MNDFEQLEGGNSNQVLRRGHTVIRQTGVWSPFVHQLLGFLNEQGFKESPIVLGATTTTETLTYIEGEVGNDPLKLSMQSDEVLIEAAQLLRRFHDITANFEVPENAQFMLSVPKGEAHEIICHNDFAPYNCVYRDGHLVGIIDFDTASPGQRIWDIAYAVYRFVPLVNPAHFVDLGWQEPLDQASRLKLFCDAYGLDDRSAVITTVIQRLEALIQYMQDNSFNLEHIPVYEADIAYIKTHQSLFKQALA